MKIIYNDFGIGMTCTDGKGNTWRELNEKLKNYPDLHEKVLEHELRHLANEDKGMKEFLNDLRIDFTEFTGWTDDFRFFLRHPMTFIESLSPLMLSKKDGWGVNPSNVVIMFLLLSTFVISQIV